MVCTMLDIVVKKSKQGTVVFCPRGTISTAFRLYAWTNVNVNLI